MSHDIDFSQPSYSSASSWRFRSWNFHHWMIFVVPTTVPWLLTAFKSGTTTCFFVGGLQGLHGNGTLWKDRQCLHHTFWVEKNSATWITFKSEDGLGQFFLAKFYLPKMFFVFLGTPKKIYNKQKLLTPTLKIILSYPVMAFQNYPQPGLPMKL